MNRSSILLLLAVVGCGRSSEPEPEPAKVEAEPVRKDLPDVLLVTLDTTRADRIGAYGYDGAHTDTIDALAARGRRYARAYSPLPLTIPSHASIFTGLYPPRHGIRANGDSVLGQDAVTLTERLQSAGYHTGASVAAFPTTRTWGFDQGFDAYFDEIPAGRNFWHGERLGAEVVDDVLGWKASLPDDGRPVFAWVHLFDAHFPYAPEEPWRTLAEGRPYDGELAYVDDQVARLVEAFGSRPTLVVVVGDHGEGLGQHHELTHGLYTFDSTQRVPFVIAGPGVEPSVVDEPVSLVDVAPTILSTLSLPALEAVDGRVVPGDPAKPVYMESWQLAARFGIAPHRAIVSGDHKLISLPQPELYDLTVTEPVDPANGESAVVERTNLAEQLPERVKELQAMLDGLGFEAPSADPAHPASPGLAAQLQALGYVDGSFGGDLSGPLPDPKDHAVMLKLVQKAEKLQLEHKEAELAPINEQLAKDYPHITEFQSKYAQQLAKKGKIDEALAILEAAIARDPDHAMLKQSKAALLASSGRFEEASILFQEVAEAMPFAPRLRAMALAALLELPDGSNKALELGMVYLQEHPGDHNVAGLLGVELARRGQLPRALKLLELGILADVPETDVAYHLAAAKLGQGKQDEALAMLKKELEHHPHNFEAVRALLALHGRKGAWQAQIDLATKFLEGSARMREQLAKAPAGTPRPPMPPPPLLADAWHARAQALFNLKQYPEAGAALAEGLKIHPESPSLLVLQANLLQQEGKPEEAKAVFERAQASKAAEDAAVAAKQAAAVKAASDDRAPPAAPAAP